MQLLACLIKNVNEFNVDGIFSRDRSVKSLLMTANLVIRFMTQPTTNSSDARGIKRVGGVPRKNSVHLEIIDIFLQACHDSYPL